MSLHRPRLSIDLRDDQRIALDNIFTHHGMQKAVFSAIIDDLIDAVNRYGPDVIYGIMSNSISIITKEKKDEH